VAEPWQSIQCPIKSMAKATDKGFVWAIMDKPSPKFKKPYDGSFYAGDLGL
jgi:hypothetical protein